MSTDMRVEAFNVFDRANPSATGGVLGTATFGQVTPFCGTADRPARVRVSF
jgi:hypothetical protein